MPKVAAIIPSLYEADGEYLKLCVESLRASGFTGEIIVVTNGGRYQPLNLKGVTRHLYVKQQGQCRAVNTGVQSAAPDTDYFLVSNADMYYAPGWDRHLVFGFPVFSPNLVEPTDNAGSAPPFKKFDGGLTVEVFNKEGVDKFIANEVNPEGNEPGFNLPFFIKKDLWELLGGYDTAFDPWGASSDTDLQMKIELAGVIPMRLRDVLVYHFSNKTPTFAAENRDFWQFNWDYLENKWGFNRDEAGSDTWYHKNMIMWDKLKYKPNWMGQYGKTTP